MDLVHLNWFTWNWPFTCHTYFSFKNLPRVRERTFSLSFPLLTPFLLLIGEVHVLFSLFRSHPGPQFARGSRYHGDMLIRLLAAKLQEENDKRICRLRPDVVSILWTLTSGFAASVRGLSTFSSVCATWKAKLQSTLLRVLLISISFEYIYILYHNIENGQFSRFYGHIKLLVREITCSIKIVYKSRKKNEFSQWRVFLFMDKSQENHAHPFHRFRHENSKWSM